MNIYIVDYLGIHCGMHYYLEAFRKVLNDLPDCQIHILSNFTDDPGEKPFFLNQYRGTIANKGICLLRNIRRLKKFIRNHPDAIYIYLTYGNTIDIPFMKIIAAAPRHIIDIHEAIAQNVDANIKLRTKFKNIYAGGIQTVISHSTRTDDFLNQYGFTGRILKVPHFKYIFTKDYRTEAVAPDITKAIDKNRLNLLFFGNLNESKGVDILIRSVNLLPDDMADRLNVIIAGKNFDGSVYREIPAQGRKIHIFARHITDDELRFLYQNVDYLSLPYRKTSQSGILEMAFYFKRPIIASDVPYFRLTLEQFPSFGHIAHGLERARSLEKEAEIYARTLSEIIATNPTGNKKEYFLPADYDRYEHRSEIIDFINDFRKLL